MKLRKSILAAAVAIAATGSFAQGPEETFEEVQNEFVAIVDSNGDGEFNQDDFSTPPAPDIEGDMETLQSAVTSFPDDPEGSLNAVLDLAAAYGLPTDSIPSPDDTTALEEILDGLSEGGGNISDPSEGGDLPTDPIDVTLSGTIPSKDDVCSLSGASELVFNFGTGVSFGSFSGKTPDLNFTILCGADREQPAQVHLSTAPNDPEVEGQGSSVVPGLFTPNDGSDPVNLEFTLFADMDSTGSFQEIGQPTSVGAINPGSNGRIQMHATVDKELLRLGGTLEHTGTPYVYLWVR